MSAVHGVVLSYIGVILLQIVWHAVLPPPAGNRLVWLAVLAALPLLVPLRGIWKKQIRSMTWGGYLLVFYLVVGIMEAWSNPQQRIPASVQVVLILLFVIFLVLFTRQAARVQNRRD